VSIEQKFPVLVLAFNRPKLVRDLIESLSPDDVSSLYVSIDGPRTEADRQKATEIVNIAKDSSKKFPVYVRLSEENLGCRLGVISGLDWFYRETIDGGLILEDDCYLDSKFFSFLRSKLHLIETQQVAMISAHNPLGHVSLGDFKSRFVFIHGWYMQIEAWENLRRSLFKLSAPSRFRHTRHPRDLSESIFWWATYARARIGIHDTWDSLFYRAFSDLGYSCLVPQNNFIENRGFGEDATHTFDPQGSIFLKDGPELARNALSSEDLDQLIAKKYFKINRFHTITPWLKVAIDYFRVLHLPRFEISLDATAAKFYTFGVSK
jgi:hypothetical protein